MSDQDQAELKMALARLRQDHADFDVAIEAMLKTGCEPLQIQRMKKKKLTKQQMALAMKTSRAQLDRVLDPKAGNVTIETLQRAAKAVGRKLRMELV